MFQVYEKTVKIGQQSITIETGLMARQAGGSVLVTCGGTQILVTACASKKESNLGFFPLSVDYIEKFYSTGRIPGGYNKREGRPSDREVLVSRLIDRPLRPLFPKEFMCETQVIAQVISYDEKVTPDVLAIVGASAALHLSDAPFEGPIAAVRVGYIDEQFVINPSKEQLENSSLNLVVAGTSEAILMVECMSNFVGEELLLKALEVAHQNVKTLCATQDDLAKDAGEEKREVYEFETDPKLEKVFLRSYKKKMEDALSLVKKSERKEALAEIKEEAYEKFFDEDNELFDDIFGRIFEAATYNIMRSKILDSGIRIDGRKTDEVRQINCRTQFLKKTHGSALFTRGETQSLGVVTLGSADDVKREENLDNPNIVHSFMLHYNFPGFSVGECKRLGSVSRREVGHGNLAHRALSNILPTKESFPYTIRIVSEILESNGSSSMATVCSGSLALMDAGVPIKEPVSGIAMGLIKEGDKFAVLSDILGDEDHLGDMDFKVAGGKSGVTALQMDIKISGVSLEILKQALEQAKKGRLHILDKMIEVLPKSRDLNPNAPRLDSIRIRPERVRDLIGPGGRHIRSITSETGCKIDVNDDGVVNIISRNNQAAIVAKQMVKDFTSDPEIGEVYLGIVKKVTDFGAFVEIKPGFEGLLHIAQLSKENVKKVEDVVREGEEVIVKVIELDRTGRIKLSRKDAIGQTPKTVRTVIG